MSEDVSHGAVTATPAEAAAEVSAGQGGQGGNGGAGLTGVQTARQSSSADTHSTQDEGEGMDEDVALDGGEATEALRCKAQPRNLPVPEARLGV